MLNKLEAITVTASVLYLGLALSVLTAFFMDGGLQKLELRAAHKDSSAEALQRGAVAWRAPVAVWPTGRPYAAQQPGGHGWYVPMPVPVPPMARNMGYPPAAYQR